MNGVIQEYEDELEFMGFEGFGGDLTELIWLRLIIEDVIFDTHYSNTTEITALNVAKEALSQGNVPDISTGHLLEACDGYLARYKDIFADLGYVPYNFNDLDESEENLFAIAARAKSNLFKTHTTELDAFVKAELGNDVTDPTKR